MTGTASPPASSRERKVAFWRWPIIGLRLLAMLVALAVSLPLYYLAAPFTARTPVPRAFLYALATISGVRIRKRGQRARGRAFFLANHVSWLDIPALAGTTGTAFVAHDGLAAIGPLRWLCDLNDTVFIARHDRRSIFPEGTTSDGLELLPFKSALLSALDADAEHIPIQPVLLDYGKETGNIAWVGAEPGLANALRILARVRPITLTVTFLPPLTDRERTNRKTIANAARQAIATAMTSARKQ